MSSYIEDVINGTVSALTRFITFTRGPVKKAYVVLFNFYSLFWLYREIVCRHTTDWETYLVGLFTYFGVFYFVLDTKDKFFIENQFNNEA